jgi:hypothetical protein
MSSLSGSAVGGEGGEKKTEVPETVPPASWKRGRPKGSHNKKTLAALAAAAATTVTPTAATGVALAPGGEGVPERRGPGRPRKGGRKKCANSGGRFFAIPPPRAAAGQQEQEDPRYPQGRYLWLCEASRGDLVSR